MRGLGFVGGAMDANPRAQTRLVYCLEPERDTLMKKSDPYVTKVLQKPSEGELAIPFALFLEFRV